MSDEYPKVVREWPGLFMRSLKACRDCKHVLTDGSEPDCGHPKSSEMMPDYYTGIYKPLIRPVSIMRTIGACRPEALLFEPKEAAPEP